MFTYDGFIERMVDADTFDVNLDLGFDVWTRQRVRLAGVDAPERYTDDGRAAETYLRETFSMPGRGDQPIRCRVQTEKPKRGKYGRYIATIWLDEGFSIAEALLAEGHATEYRA